MMKLSNRSAAVVAAYERGYRVLENGKICSPVGTIRKTCAGTNGYLRLNIKVRKCHRSVDVHRLAAYQKFGDRLFCPGIQVRHLNGNRQDNSLTNIGIGNQSDNMMDRPAAMRQAIAIQAAHARTKFTQEDILSIRQRLANGETGASIAQEYSVAKTTISEIRNRHTFRCF